MATLVPRRWSDLAEWLDSEFRMGEGRAIRIEDHFGDREYELCAELPGVDPEKDVEVRVDNGVLSIRAERREHAKTEGRSEFRYGQLERSVRLPSNADAEHVAASYADGLLSVKVPLTTPETSGRKIEIRRVGEAGQPAVEAGKSN